MRFAPAIIVIPTKFLQSWVGTLRDLAIRTIVEGADRPGPAGVLPLRLGWKLWSQARRLLIQTFQIILAILPAYTFDRSPLTFETAGLLPLPP
jgi:hypothetical protein